MMNREFALDQRALLRVGVIDRQMHGGVCWAMSYDWIKRGLCALGRTRPTYTNVARFVSQQRALRQGWAIVNYRTMAPPRDGLVVNSIKQGPIRNAADWGRLARSIGTCGRGVYELGVWGVGWNHATAFSNEAGARRFFDPELGQYLQVGAGGPGDYIVNTLLVPTYGVTVTNWEIWQYTGAPRDAVWLQNNP